MPPQKPIDLGSGEEPEVSMELCDSTHAAVDIPMDVLTSLVLEVLNRDLMSPAKTEAIFDAAAQSLGRLGDRVSPRFH